MSDTLYKQNGDRVVNHSSSKQQCVQLFDMIRASYPWFDPDFHFAAADPYIHEVLNETVIRTCFRTDDAKEMLGYEVGSAHRMFCMDSQTSFVIATELFTEDQPDWKPEGAHVVAVTSHHEEYRKPAPSGFNSFREYFIACRPEVAEKFFGLDVAESNNDTLYAVLSNGTDILAARLYTNQVEGVGDELLANWQSIYVKFCKKARRIDLARELFALNI